MLRAKMPPDTQIFGCKEYHVDGTPHYHAVVCFEHSVYWENARCRFWLKHPDGSVDTRSVHIVTPKVKDDELRFLDRTQRYCRKNANGDVFGEMIVLPPSPGSCTLPCGRCKEPVSTGAVLRCRVCAREMVQRSAKVDLTSTMHGGALVMELPTNPR
jgi:hypothetical protein